MNKQNKQTTKQTHIHRQQYGSYRGKGNWEEEDKSGDRRRLDFGC